MIKKTDNHNLGAKLQLRRYFLDKYHCDSKKITVMDCCAGDSVIWNRLRKDYPVSYWGMDKKKKKGRLQIESERVLQQAGWKADVIDIDTYGQPWKHYFAMLKTMRNGGLTVFLTIGQIAPGGGNFDRRILEPLGINFKTLTIPNALGVKLSHHSLVWSYTHCYDFGAEIKEALESVSDGNARYIGLRIAK